MTALVTAHHVILLIPEFIRVSHVSNSLSEKIRLQKPFFAVAGVRGQESGDRSQGSGVRSQESGDRGQETGDRSQ